MSPVIGLEEARALWPLPLPFARPALAKAILMDNMFKSIFHILLLVLILPVHAQTLPFRPGGIPIAVRAPYLNFWLLGGRQGPNLGRDWTRVSNNDVSL